MSITPKLLVVACALSCAVALSACGDRAATGAQQPGTQAQDEALPKPDQQGGSITGMSSRPGPGEVPLTGEPPPPLVAEPADQVDLLNPETGLRSEEHTSELQPLMRISYAVFCSKKKKIKHQQQHTRSLT